METTIWAATVTTEGEVFFHTTAPSLREKQAVVGGLIAPVMCPHGDTVYVNDEGLLMGLDANMGAMLVTLSRSTLVGDAIVCGPLDDEGEHLPLSAPVLKFLRWLSE